MKCKPYSGLKLKCKLATGLSTKSVNLFQDESEIHYYRRQIRDYETEDLLLRIIGQKPINKKKIADTERRIENLFWAMQDW